MISTTSCLRIVDNYRITSPALSVPSVGSDWPYEQFGRALVAADFNADGFSDFAAGVANASVQELTNAGQIEVHWGPDFSDNVVLVASEVVTNGFYGERLCLGDFNGDGVPDIVVGNPRKPVGGVPSMGEVHLLVSPSLDHVKTLAHPLPSGSNSRFGNAVVGWDLDGDGIDEVIATDQRNHTFIFWSPTFDDDTVVTRPPDPVTGTTTSVSFGYFAAAGDVNGDGWNDLLISEPFADGGTGRVYAALGPYYSSFLVLADKVPEAPAEFGWGLNVVDIDDDHFLDSDLASSAGVLGAGHVSVLGFDP
jgi:hypothetical protein